MTGTLQWARARSQCKHAAAPACNDLCSANLVAHPSVSAAVQCLWGAACTLWPAPGPSSLPQSVPAWAASSCHVSGAGIVRQLQLALQRSLCCTRQQRCSCCPHVNRCCYVYARSTVCLIIADVLCDCQTSCSQHLLWPPVQRFADTQPCSSRSTLVLPSPGVAATAAAAVDCSGRCRSRQQHGLQALCGCVIHCCQCLVSPTGCPTCANP